MMMQYFAKFLQQLQLQFSWHEIDWAVYSSDSTWCIRTWMSRSL